MTPITLSPAQARIVEMRDGAILVEAGPGSGKTRVLTERIRRLTEEGGSDYKVLALTFTNKAAIEMRERLEGTVRDLDDHVWIGTIHKFCLEIISSRGKSVGIDGEPTIFENRADRRRVLRQAADGEPLLLQAIGRCRSAEDELKLLNSWLTEISEAKRRLQRPEQVRRIDPVLAAAYEAYDAGLRNSHAVDYDDILLLAHRIFTERPEIPAFYRRLYRYLCIDEAQDLNEAQYRFLTAFAGPDYRNIMLVGDPQQTIYVFNGSHSRYLEQFVRDFDAVRERLTENFRSARCIIEAAARLAGGNQEPGLPSAAASPIKGDIRAFSLMDENAEAEFLVSMMRRLMKEGHPDISGRMEWNRMAVLARTSYVLAPLERLLEISQIPHFKRVTVEDTYQSLLLREFELMLRLLANPRDRLHYDLLVESWGLAGIVGPMTNSHGRIDLAAIFSDPHRLPTRATVAWEALQRAGPADVDFDLHPAIPVLKTYADSLDDVEERAGIHADLDALENQWRTFLRSGPGGTRRLISFLTSVAMGIGRQPAENGVALLTVHSAKGLEFDVVFVMGFVQGVFPDYRANTPAALEEEQRNAYVAITRAKRLCYITFPRKRKMPWGDVRTQQPSPFIGTMNLQPEAR